MIGSGRVGSSVALELQREGWEVVVIDENEDALGRLGEHWPGTFLVGHGMDVICPTRIAIDGLMDAVRTCAIPAGTDAA